MEAKVRTRPVVIVVDVDGVMTDGGFHYDAEGSETFDHKWLWSRVLETPVHGRGALPGLPGEAPAHEEGWSRELMALSGTGASELAPLVRAGA